MRQEGGGPQAGTDKVPIWEADGAAPPPWVLGPRRRQAASQLNVGAWIVCAREDEPTGLQQEKEQKEGHSQFSKCPTEDSAGGRRARSTQHSRVHTHNNQVLAFLRICKVDHNTCPQKSEQHRNTQSKSETPREPAAPLTSFIRSNYLESLSSSKGHFLV